jgi:hypothetical protein
LTDVVIPSAIPVCLGHPIIIGDRHFRHATRLLDIDPK